MLIGYASLSADDENLAPQLDALRAAGCETIFEDTGSGAGENRKGLAEALARCGAGDVLMVWKLSRLGGSLAADLAAVVEDLRGRGTGLKVLTGAGAVIDTAGPEFTGILAAIAEFERERRIEWLRRARETMRRRGDHHGRPRKLKPDDVARARQLIAAGRSRRKIAALLGVHVDTLRLALKGPDEIGGRVERANRSASAVLTPDTISHARQMIDSGEQSVSGMAKLLGVHRVILHKALKGTLHPRRVHAGAYDRASGNSDGDFSASKTGPGEEGPS